MNQFEHTNLSIGGNSYIINQQYYIAGEIGRNLANWPRLTSFSKAYISTKNGLSQKYPEYHFNFELVQRNSYDSGLSNIYKLTITKILPFQTPINQ